MLLDRNRFRGPFNNNLSSLRGLKTNSNRNVSIIPNNNLRKNNNNSNQGTNTKRRQKEKINQKELKEYEEKTYSEINSLSYEDALANDKRTFFQYYISLLMTKQLLLFTFNCKNDYNSKIMKISFVLYIFSIFLFVNTLFIDESILHDLFIFQGKIDLLYNYMNIIYITLISSFVKNILALVIFTEDDVISLKTDDNYIYHQERIRKVLNTITIKFQLFFALSIFSLVFIWVYIACFFTVYKNTQMFVLRNTLVCFGISLLIPVLFGFVPAIFRFTALSSRESKNRLCVYLISKILQVLI